MHRIRTYGVGRPTPASNQRDLAPLSRAPEDSSASLQQRQNLLDKTAKATSGKGQKSGSSSPETMAAPSLGSLPLPSRMFGQLISQHRDLVKSSQVEHKKRLPAVFVVTQGAAEGSSEPRSLLGTDFLQQRDEQDELVYDADQSPLHGVRSVALFLPSGEVREIHRDVLEKNDPTGFFTENLLALNVSTPQHRAQDAEVRIAVAAALRMGTFGFADDTLAGHMVASIESADFAMGQQRVFHTAVGLSLHALVKHLVTDHVDVNEPSEDDGQPALFVASQNHDEQMVQILQSAGALFEF